MMNLRKIPAFLSTTRAARGAGARRVAVALALGGVAVAAMAQYKVVGPDGSVTYTDTPPAAAARPMANGNADGGGGGGGLPYATRQAMAKYPVALYAAKNCNPCDSVRQWLRSHGIPFTEYSIDNDPSVKQLNQRFGVSQVPITTFGGQTVNGFSSADLQSYADAAGYPAHATLSGYSWPAAVPLATAPAAPAQAAKATAAASALLPPPTSPPVSRNGIQF